LADNSFTQVSISGSTDGGTCATGHSTLTATVPVLNNSQSTLNNLYATNITLTGGNTLISDSVSATSAGPGVTVTFTFHIQLATCNRFRLTFDVGSN
jgi:hypothetical protein